MLVSTLFTANAENYTIQKFFGDDDNGVFHDLHSGELLKPIIDNNRTIYLEQDGDIFEEDVATVEDKVMLSLLNQSYSFSKSKRLLAKSVYTDHLIAFYSGCRYRLKNKTFVPIASSCGFKYRKNKARSQRIEWEHIVPAWLFGHQLKCWQQGGRLYCRNTHAKFKQMEADMHNLVPAIGEINGDRSNYRYRMIADEKRLYGEPVNMEISFKTRSAEPPENVQGDIARTYFYMVDRYQIKISDQQQKMFIAWNNQDPVDSWEHKKNQLVKKLQGDENFYITHYKKLKQGDVLSSLPPENIGDINDSLKERFALLYHYLPAQIVEILLAIFAVYLFFKYKRKRKAAAKKSSQAKVRAKAKPKISSRVKTNVKKNPRTKPVQKLTAQGYYLIQSHLVDRVLSINSKGKLVIKKVTHQDSQYWQLIDSNKTEGFIFIKNRQTGTVLEIESALEKDHAKVIFADKKRRNNNHQEWRVLLDVDSGHNFIVNRSTQTVLDVSYKKTQENSRVASYHKKSRGVESQLWEMIKVDT